ncbi:MAG: 6-pyruvoyl trahydropterin synthase family protein [Thermoplasmatota archaeon]
MSSEIRIDGWRSGIRFDAAHVIPHHPKCGRLHGHTYAIHCVVAGEPGANGFVMDFGEVKRALKLIADRLDHHVLVAAKAPDATVKESTEGVEFAFGGKRYAIPSPDALLLPIEYSSAESLAAYVAAEVRRAVTFPPGVKRLEIGVDESYGKGAWTVLEF